MKNVGIMLCAILSVALLGTACNGKKGISYWENAPVVAEIVNANGAKLISFDPALLKDTITIPISHLMEEIEIVKLDESDEALVGEDPIVISENYILVKNSSRTQTPCKLFDKKGNFIGNVGAIGQGPGEYRNIYSMQIDEVGGKIYLLPWFGDNLLAYDLKGQPVTPIKLPYRANKGIFKVKGDKVTVAVLPFPDIPVVAWIQTLEGDVLQEMPAGSLAVARDFSNEIISSQNTPDMDLSFWFWPTRIDTLYHINAEQGTLEPRFTANFDVDNMEPHSYAEWPDYFVGNTKVIYESSSMTADGKTSTQSVGTKNEYYVVDKKTLKGAFLRVENDYWGGIEEWPIYLFDKGYYARNMDPGNMEEWIEKMLKSDRISDQLRQKLTGINGAIGANDNNYVIYAKMKR